MAATEAQARRAARRMEVPWAPEVADPRAVRNQRHGHHGLLNPLASALACGLFNLRRVEDFSEDLPQSTRRRWDIGRPVSHTTLYRVLSAQEVAGFRETVWRQVRSLMEQKAIRPREMFQFGVLSIDGKCVWASAGVPRPHVARFARPP